MIIARDLCKTFGSTRVLDGVDFELASGTLTALVGGNGAGKSTLLKIMGGAIPATSGQVLVGPHRMPVRSVQDAISAQVRASYQEGSLIPAWTVAEHFPPLPSTEAAALWAKFAPHVRPSDRIRDLNQLDLQLIEVARSLANSPIVVLADEPTAGLDPATRVAILEAMKRSASKGATVLWVTHDLGAALAAADRILIMRAGKLVRDTTPAASSITTLLADLSGTETRVVPRRISPAAEKATSSGTELEFFGIKIRPGRVVGLVGRSTAGVSEAMRTAYRDQLRVKRTSLSRKPRPTLRYMSRERSTEWDFERQDVEFNLTAAIVRRHSRAGFRNRRIERAEASTLMSQFEISAPGLDADIGELSGGNRQKVVLARMASCRPELLLLDEPFSGVDAPTRQALGEQIRSLAAEGATVVIHSQEVSDLLRCVDQLIVVRNYSQFLEIDDWANSDSIIETWLAAPTEVASR
jgi:ABC-type sugar transport system ATPase subunit